MKSAEEWLQEKGILNSDGNKTLHITTIEAIQQNARHSALTEAAEVKVSFPYVRSLIEQELFEEGLNAKTKFILQLRDKKDLLTTETYPIVCPSCKNGLIPSTSGSSTTEICPACNGTKVVTVTKNNYDNYQCS